MVRTKYNPLNLPGIGVRSSLDAAGNIAFYVYDAAARLKAVYDVYGNPVSGYYYKFATGDWQ